MEYTKLWSNKREESSVSLIFLSLCSTSPPTSASYSGAASQPLLLLLLLCVIKKKKKKWEKWSFMSLHLMTWQLACSFDAQGGRSITRRRLRHLGELQRGGTGMQERECKKRFPSQNQCISDEGFQRPSVRRCRGFGRRAETHQQNAAFNP